MNTKFCQLLSHDQEKDFKENGIQIFFNDTKDVFSYSCSNELNNLS